MSDERWKGNIEEMNVPKVTKITEKVATFANGATANTAVMINDIPVPSKIRRIYTVAIANPSTESDITVQLFLKETINSVDKWCDFGEPITISKTTNAYHAGRNTKMLLVHGAMFAKGLGIGIKVDSTITTGFDAGVVVREGD